MKYYTEGEALDKVLGEKGTPLRNQYEADINAFLIGEAIKKARQSKNLTQEELGAMIGVKKSQVSRIEKGGNITFATVAKIFRAMGISASFEIYDISGCQRHSSCKQSRISKHISYRRQSGTFRVPGTEENPDQS